MKPSHRMRLAQLALEWAELRAKLDDAATANNWLEVGALVRELDALALRGVMANLEIATGLD